MKFHAFYDGSTAIIFITTLIFFIIVSKQIASCTVHYLLLERCIIVDFNYALSVEVPRKKFMKNLRICLSKVQP